VVLSARYVRRAREAQVQKPPMISIVDDDGGVREGLMDLIKSMGFEAESYSSASDFLKSPDRRITSCLIADVQMPEMTRLELHDCLVKLGDIIPAILVIAFPNDRDRKWAARSGVIRYLAKPFNDDDLFARIRSVLESR
jgi:FixJ family two-component response regulator